MLRREFETAAHRRHTQPNVVPIGPFSSPPECCESLASVVSRFGGSVEIRVAATSVEYELPRDATDEVRAFWQEETRAAIPPVVVARLPGGRVFGSGIVLAPDGRSVARDVSLDFGKTTEEHWLLTYEKIAPPQVVSGATAVVATTLGMGYGHWLLDELPRLLTLKRDEADHLIAHAAQPFSRAALERAGWMGAILPAERGAHFQCEELVVPSHNGTVVQPTLRGLELIAEFTEGLHTATSAWGERIYLSRENARRRGLTNESELWAELKPAGFVKVRLEELPWPEQINAFRHAKVVVAPHGAGLANLAFCRPGTMVVEIFNRAYVHGCFWRLAALQGLDYRPVVADGAEPFSQGISCNRLDIEADIRLVRRTLL